MTTFDFSKVGGSFSRLEPGIHEVVFKGVEKADFPAKDGSGKVYKTLRFNFSKGNATFSHTLFEPREEDFERTSNTVKTKDGKTANIPQASGAESTMLFIKHLLSDLDPDFVQKIDSGEVSFGGNSWEELRTNVINIFNKHIGKNTKIKLVPDRNGEARFPRFFAAVGRDGKAYVRNRFIGNSIAFTAYEKSLFKEDEEDEDDSFDFVASDSEDVDDLDFDLSL